MCIYIITAFNKDSRGFQDRIVKGDVVFLWWLIINKPLLSIFLHKTHAWGYPFNRGSIVYEFFTSRSLLIDKIFKNFIFQVEMVGMVTMVQECYF